MSRRVFCCCYSTGDYIDSDSPYQTDKDSAIGMALQVMRRKGDYFGMVDDEEITLQFMLEDDHCIVMEIPSPSEGGAYCKTISIDNLEAVLLSLADRFSPSDIADMTFVRW